MAVNSASPQPPGQDWIYFTVGLGAMRLSIASGISLCMSDPAVKLLHDINYQADDFYMSCNLNKSDGQIEFSVTKRGW
jgi:hypothetical protein